MDLPVEIKNYIENELNKDKIKSIKADAQTISNNYRKNKRTGNSLLSKKEETIAYAMSRMPATFGAISKALEKTLEIYNPLIESVADIGAGTGSAGIAIAQMLDIEKIDCYEKEKVMIETGEKICNEFSVLKNKISWNKLDIVNEQIINKYDLVISGYMINELKIQDFENVIKKMWDSSNDLIIIVEPGTVQGYENIMRAKEILINLGGKIIAPCMSNKCNLPKDDWCNFYCRVQRTKIHKNLKSGTLPFEDEKFIYIAVTKKEISVPNNARIIRHPLIYSGYVKLKICKNDGTEEITISKKEKEKFKLVKKMNHGDLISN